MNNSIMYNFSDKLKDKFINELFEFIKIPSISADSKYTKEVHKTALWVEKALKKVGCNKTKIFKTKGHPIVFGEQIIDPKLKTVLVYGHYDVQPPDPIELWDSNPFDPIIKKTKLHPEGAIFGRGSCDDKGQVFMHFKALELMNLNGLLNCNVKFMIEGEEEVGSDNLELFVKKNKNLLKNDIILISDTSIISNVQPSITTGLRGLSYMEVLVKGAKRDLHSGLYGGSVLNPIHVLTKMISKLHDSDNKITIPRFYEEVIPIRKKDREKISLIPFNLNNYKSELNINEVSGEIGYSTLERSSIRPTLDVNGIWGGYTGEGAKTIIPSKAHAKISMRLVPNQNWKKISKGFEDHFKNLAPKGVKVTVKTHHGAAPFTSPLGSVGYTAAKKAYTKSFGVEPIDQKDGGSIPIVPVFEEILNSRVILMGFGLNSDAIHSPNEHFGLFNFFKGIETIILFYKYYSEKNKN
ncbi:MAG: dipeptidase [Flavobacteriaceae bacterium]|nr:dipeptidase [Flavobacteriaceae bacterium]